MRISKIKIIANLLALLPASIIVARYLNGSLSANPIQTATVITGRTAVYALLISLYCSPLARITRMSLFHRLRKTAGLYSFFYALIHFLIFIILDYRLKLDWILPEIKQKPFLQIGLLALLLLLPLAITSITKLRNSMGSNWKKLHSIVYGISAVILLHVSLASKGDLIDPAILIAIYLLAMLLRLPPLRSLQIKSLPEWLRKLNTFLIA